MKLSSGLNIVCVRIKLLASTASGIADPGSIVQSFQVLFPQNQTCYVVLMHGTPLEGVMGHLIHDYTFLLHYAKQVHAHAHLSIGSCKAQQCGNPAY